MNESDKSLWKVIFSANYKSTVEHYDLYIFANDIKEAIELAEKWYIDHLQKGEDIEEPYVHTATIVSSFVVSAQPLNPARRVKIAS